MALTCSLNVALLLFVWSAARCNVIPDGVLHMECHERYFMIAADLSFTGDQPRFDAVDGTGVHPITTTCEARCGYTINVFPLLGHMELRASYFSCYTGNKDDEVFTFNFNLITNHEGKEATYALQKTCSLSVPWSRREVLCEDNYMEVSVQSPSCCRLTSDQKGLDLAKRGTSSIRPYMQLTFQKGEEHSQPMNYTEVQERGYYYKLTDGRFVFRTPYGQPEALSTEVNGVPVEMVHVTLFTRYSWAFLMVDLVAACSTHEGSYDGGYVMWQIPEVLYPAVISPHFRIGLNGELEEQPVAEQKGYILALDNTTVNIGIPYNGEGVHRKSIVSDGLQEFYIVPLTLAELLVDDDYQVTRLQYRKTLTTPLLPRPLLTENQTVLGERVFTVYLGDVPEDAMLASVQLNGQEFTVPFANESGHTITRVVHPNYTHSFTLKVPFDDPVVKQQVLKADGCLQYTLDINYTLIVVPENDPYYHLASVVAIITDFSPPAFEANCTESGISFKLDHRPLDHLWDFSIGSALLTPELAAQRGYIMTNDSWSLVLTVPLFTNGYTYTDITLKGFSATLELLVRDRETSEVQASTVKTCPFASTEFIMCSTDGRMTAVADLSLAIPSGTAARTNLVDESCGPTNADGTSVLFSASLSSCGFAVVTVGVNVTYQNEIFYNGNELGSAATERVILQCTYPLTSLLRLFSTHTFISDTVGFGRIIHTALSTTGLHDPSQPTAAPQTTRAASRPQQQKRFPFLYARRPPTRYVKVSNVQKQLGGGGKGPDQFSQAKQAFLFDV